MVKEITNIFINSAIAVNSENANTGNGRIYSIYFDVPPIIIRNKANLKVANICHMGSGQGQDKVIYYFKLDGIMTQNNRYISNDGGMPTILATTFDSSRNLYEENDIPLIKQTINTIRLIISDDLLNINAGIPDTIKFCMSLKIEEEVNEPN